MDTTTTTRTWIRRTAVALAIAAATMTLGATRAAPAPRPLAFTGADATDEAAVDWALHRFRTGGLRELPPLEVHLHRSREGCDGGLGLYSMNRIDLCTKDSSEPYARKYALHEIAHAWAETNVDPGLMRRFMDVRDVEAWNDQRVPWKERGTEQAAEIIAWGLGEGEIVPTLSEPLESKALAGLYELLTGRAPITPAAT
jgi:hypothetical protein